MRLLRFLIVSTLLIVAGWLVAQSFSVQTTEGKVQITIDRQKLGQAGHELKDKSRRAMGKVGQALQSAGRQLDEKAGDSEG